MTFRTRSRGGPQAIGTFTEFGYHTNCSHTTWTPTGYAATLRGGHYETFTDVKVPNFKKRQAAGELFFNTMSSEKWQGFGSGNGYYVTSVGYGCPANLWKAEYDGQGNGSYLFLQKQTRYGSEVPKLFTIVSASTVRDLESEVSTRMLSQRGMSETNLFESLAEIDQTVGLFNKPISRLFQTFHKAAQAKKRGEFTGFTVNGVSNLWLAYRYGITPLLNDIEAITEGLKKKTALRRETTRAKKGFESSSKISYQSNVGIIRCNVDVDITESYTVRAMSLDEFSTSLYENIGFTPKALITVPWELVRFSFVADWFVNIGDFLGAITPAFGWKNLGSCLTTINGCFNRSTVYGGVSTNSGWVLNTQPNGTYDQHLLRRYRGQVRFPDLVIKNDFRFDKPKRVADALALLAQQGTAIFGKSLPRTVI